MFQLQQTRQPTTAAFQMYIPFFIVLRPTDPLQQLLQSACIFGTEPDLSITCSRRIFLILHCDPHGWSAVPVHSQKELHMASETCPHESQYRSGDLGVTNSQKLCCFKYISLVNIVQLPKTGPSYIVMKVSDSGIAYPLSMWECILPV